jgi:hypothetical protein
MKRTQQKHRWLKITVIIFGSLLFALPLTLWLLPRPYFKTGFTSLPLIEAYVTSKNEQYTMDSENTIKPDFGKFYATMKPTSLAIFKEKLLWLGALMHLAQPPIWTPSYFKELMLTLAKQRQADGYQGDQIVKITPTAESKIILFGNLQGAMHSFARCLGKLKQLDILKDDLTLTKPDYFIVFTGDVVSRSPFTMPTLSLVCTLLAKNPKQVVYLRGNHESKNYWQEHTLKTELQLFASHLGKGDIPLAEEVNAFFNTLPIAAYISLTGENKNEFIRISDAGRSENEQLQEGAFSSFLTSKSDKAITAHSLDKKDDQASPVAIKVIFRGEKKRESYQPHEGMRLLQPDMDSTAWTILSCPTVGYQKAIKFVHDAFAIITPGKTADDWSVTLYNRDVRTKNPFKATPFNLLSGEDDSAEKKTRSTPDEKKEPQTKNPAPRESLDKKKTTTPAAVTPAEPVPASALVDDEPSAFKPL